MRHEWPLALISAATLPTSIPNGENGETTSTVNGRCSLFLGNPGCAPFARAGGPWVKVKTSSVVGRGGVAKSPQCIIPRHAFDPFFLTPVRSASQTPPLFRAGMFVRPTPSTVAQFEPTVGLVNSLATQWVLPFGTRNKTDAFCPKPLPLHYALHYPCVQGAFPCIPAPALHL
jgi:hypothetical protein